MGNSFVVDVPPSVNNLYHNAGKGRRMTVRGKAYKEYAGWVAKEWARENDWEYEGGNVAMGLDLVFPNKIRRDITNCIKIVEDAVSETLGFDDKKCVEFIVRLIGYDKENPKAIFTLLNGDQLRSCGHCRHHRARTKPRVYEKCMLISAGHPLTSIETHKDFGCNNFDLFVLPFEMEEIWR